MGAASLPYGKWLDEFRDVPHLLLNEAVWWIIAGSVLGYVRYAEGRAFATVGFRVPRPIDIGIGIAGGVVTLAGLVAIIDVLLPSLHVAFNQDAMTAISATPYWWRAISVLRAAVSEEVIFRGYAIERLCELTGSRGIAAVVSCAIFTLAHVGPWGWSHIFVAGFGGLAFTCLYLWRRNLWLNMLAHFIVDGAAFL